MERKLRPYWVSTVGVTYVHKLLHIIGTAFSATYMFATCLFPCAVPGTESTTVATLALCYLDHFMLGCGYTYTSHYAIALVFCVGQKRSQNCTVGSCIGFSQLCRMPSSCCVAGHTEHSLN